MVGDVMLRAGSAAPYALRRPITMVSDDFVKFCLVVSLFGPGF